MIQTCPGMNLDVPLKNQITDSAIDNNDDSFKDPDYEPDRQSKDSSSDEQETLDLRVDHEETVETATIIANDTPNISKRQPESSWKKIRQNNYAWKARPIKV